MRIHGTFFPQAPAPTDIYTLSLHDALPISVQVPQSLWWRVRWRSDASALARAQRDKSLFAVRSEEHTSELQSRFDLVCRLLLEKKNWNRCLLLRSSIELQRFC